MSMGYLEHKGIIKHISEFSDEEIREIREEMIEAGLRKLKGAKHMNKAKGTYFPQFLTTGAVARSCGVSKVTVLRWIAKGDIVAFRLPGGQNRIRREDFLSFAKKHNIPTE